MVYRMKVDIRENTSTWEALLERLAELKESRVRVGFFDEEVAEYAAYNEFGTSEIPSRPFMRMATEEHAEEVASFMEEQAKAVINGGDAMSAFNSIGEYQVEMVRQTIESGSFAPNAPSTIARKGSSTPLVDTGRMLDSIEFMVEGKE